MLSKRMMHQHKDGVYYMSRDSVAKHVAKLEAENEALMDFVLWLTPCADDMPEYPSYKLIGEKAKALLKESE